MFQKLTFAFAAFSLKLMVYDRGQNILCYCGSADISNFGVYKDGITVLGFSVNFFSMISNSSSTLNTLLT